MGSSECFRSRTRIPPLVRMAALTGVDSTIRVFLEKGGSADLTDDEGRSILQIAASKGNVSVCRLLLAAGASPLVEDKQGVNALGAALASGCEEVSTLIRDFSDSTAPTCFVLSEGAVEARDASLLSSAQSNQNTILDIESTIEAEKHGENNTISKFLNELSLNEDIPLSWDGWEPEPDIDLGLATYNACNSLAEFVQGRITKHRVVDHDEDWSDVSIILPVVHRGKIQFSFLGENEISWISRLISRRSGPPSRTAVRCRDFWSPGRSDF